MVSALVQESVVHQPMIRKRESKAETKALTQSDEQHQKHLNMDLDTIIANDRKKKRTS